MLKPKQPAGFSNRKESVQNKVGRNLTKKTASSFYQYLLFRLLNSSLKPKKSNYLPLCIDSCLRRRGKGGADGVQKLSISRSGFLDQPQPFASLLRNSAVYTDVQNGTVGSASEKINSTSVMGHNKIFTSLAAASLFIPNVKNGKRKEGHHTLFGINDVGRDSVRNFFPYRKSFLCYWLLPFVGFVFTLPASHCASATKAGQNGEMENQNKTLNSTFNFDSAVDSPLEKTNKIRYNIPNKSSKKNEDSLFLYKNFKDDFWNSFKSLNSSAFLSKGKKGDSNYFKDSDKVYQQCNLYFQYFENYLRLNTNLNQFENSSKISFFNKDQFNTADIPIKSPSYEGSKGSENSRISFNSSLDTLVVKEVKKQSSAFASASAFSLRKRYGGGAGASARCASATEEVREGGSVELKREDNKTSKFPLKLMVWSGAGCTNSYESPLELRSNRGVDGASAYELPEGQSKPAYDALGKNSIGLLKTPAVLKSDFLRTYSNVSPISSYLKASVILDNYAKKKSIQSLFLTSKKKQSFSSKSLNMSEPDFFNKKQECEAAAAAVAVVYKNAVSKKRTEFFFEGTAFDNSQKRFFELEELIYRFFVNGEYDSILKTKSNSLSKNNELMCFVLAPLMPALLEYPVQVQEQIFEGIWTLIFEEIWTEFLKTVTKNSMKAKQESRKDFKNQSSISTKKEISILIKNEKSIKQLSKQTLYKLLFDSLKNSFFSLSGACAVGEGVGLFCTRTDRISKGDSRATAKPYAPKVRADDTAGFSISFGDRIAVDAGKESMQRNDKVTFTEENPSLFNREKKKDNKEIKLSHPILMSSAFLSNSSLSNFKKSNNNGASAFDNSFQRLNSLEKQGLEHSPFSPASHPTKEIDKISNKKHIKDLAFPAPAPAPKAKASAQARNGLTGFSIDNSQFEKTSKDIQVPAFFAYGLHEAPEQKKFKLALQSSSLQQTAQSTDSLFISFGDRIKQQSAAKQKLNMNEYLQYSHFLKKYAVNVKNVLLKTRFLASVAPTELVPKVRVLAPKAQRSESLDIFSNKRQSVSTRGIYTYSESSKMEKLLRAYFSKTKPSPAPKAKAQATAKPKPSAQATAKPKPQSQVIKKSLHRRRGLFLKENGADLLLKNTLNVLKWTSRLKTKMDKKFREKKTILFLNKEHPTISFKQNKEAQKNRRYACEKLEGIEIVKQFNNVYKQKFSPRLLLKNRHFILNDGLTLSRIKGKGFNPVSTYSIDVVIKPSSSFLAKEKLESYLSKPLPAVASARESSLELLRNRSVQTQPAPKAKAGLDFATKLNNSKVISKASNSFSFLKNNDMTKLKQDEKITEKRPLNRVLKQLEVFDALLRYASTITRDASVGCSISNGDGRSATAFVLSLPCIAPSVFNPLRGLNKQAAKQMEIEVATPSEKALATQAIQGEAQQLDLRRRFKQATHRIFLKKWETEIVDVSLETKRLYIQKKFKKSKIKRQTYNLTKRYRLYSRPNWIIYRVYWHFLKKKYDKNVKPYYTFYFSKGSLSKLFQNKKEIPYSSLLRSKDSLFEQRSIRSASATSTNSCACAPSLLRLKPQVRGVDGASSASLLTNSRPYIVLKTPKTYADSSLISLTPSKENFQISRVLLGNFKSVLWKSYWLRSNFNSYFKEVKTYLTEIKESTQRWEFFRNVNSFLNFLGGFISPFSPFVASTRSDRISKGDSRAAATASPQVSSPLETTPQPYGSKNLRFFERSAAPTKLNLRLKLAKQSVQNISAGFQDSDSQLGNLEIVEKNPNRFFFSNSMNFSKWEQSLYFSEYNRITYKRIHEFISKIRQNFALIQGNSERMGRHGKSRLAATHISQYDLADRKREAIFSKRKVEPFLVKLGKTLTAERYKQSYILKNSWLFKEPTFPQLRMYWAFSKTSLLRAFDANGLFNEFNKRKETWTVGDTREQTRSNKTLKIYRDLSIKLDNLLNEQHELWALWNSKFRLKNRELLSFSFLNKPAFDKGFTLSISAFASASSISVVEGVGDRRGASTDRLLRNSEGDSLASAFDGGAGTKKVQAEEVREARQGDRRVKQERKSPFLPLVFQRVLKKARLKEEKSIYLFNKSISNPAVASPKETRPQSNSQNLTALNLHQYKKNIQFGKQEVQKSFGLKKSIASKHNAGLSISPAPSAWSMTLTQKSSYWWSDAFTAKGFMPLELSQLQFRNKTETSRSLRNTESYFPSSQAFTSLSFPSFMSKITYRSEDVKGAKKTVPSLLDLETKAFQISALLFHFCSIISLISISQIRDLLKVYFLGISQLFKSSISIFGFAASLLVRLRRSTRSHRLSSRTVRLRRRISKGDSRACAEGAGERISFGDPLRSPKEIEYGARISFGDTTATASPQVSSPLETTRQPYGAYSFAVARATKVLRQSRTVRTLLSKNRRFFEPKVRKRYERYEKLKLNSAKAKATEVFESTAIVKKPKVFAAIVQSFASARTGYSNGVGAESRAHRSGAESPSAQKEAKRKRNSFQFLNKVNTLISKSVTLHSPSMLQGKLNNDISNFETSNQLLEKASRTPSISLSFGKVKESKKISFTYQKRSPYVNVIELKKLSQNQKWFLKTYATLYSGIFRDSFLLNLYDFSFKTNRLLEQTFYIFFCAGPRSLFQYLEKPEELVVDRIAYGFLLEWAGDITNTIPDNVDFYLGKTTLKATRFIHGVNLSLFEEEKGSFLKNISIFNIGSTFIQRRIYHLYEILLERIYQPDTDLIVCQKKGVIFRDIWGEFLMQVAESSNINISELASQKEEQMELFENAYENWPIESQKNNNLSPLRSPKKIEEAKPSPSAKPAPAPKAKAQKSNNKQSFIFPKGVKGFKSFVPLFPMPFSKVNPILDKAALARTDSLRAEVVSPSELRSTQALASAFSDLRRRFVGRISFGDPSAGAKEVQTLAKRSNIVGSNSFYTAKLFQAQQVLSYYGKDTELFIDLHPPKSFSMVSFFKRSDTVLYPIGSLVCQIFSGIMSKQSSKNILVIGPGSSIGRDGVPEKTLLIQAIAGETEFRIITDNAYRYTMVDKKGVAVGMKLLRDVFDSLIFHTPCLFLLEDIHAIGEKRPLLMTGEDMTKGEATNSFSGRREAKQHKEKVSYLLNNYVIKYYLKPFKGGDSRLIPTNSFCLDLFQRNTGFAGNYSSKLQNFSLKSPLISIDSEKKKSNDLQMSKPAPAQAAAEPQASKHTILSSRLLVKTPALFAPPATSPFSIFALKEAKKFNPYKIVSEAPLSGFSSEKLTQISKSSYSVRVKIALLADMVLSTLTVKLDMITDLLVIIDSVRGNHGFVVFATTHVPYLLDPALRRPGRLDETIAVNFFPSILSRWEILKSSCELFTAGKEQTGFNKGLSLDLTYSITFGHYPNSPSLLSNSASWGCGSAAGASRNAEGNSFSKRMKKNTLSFAEGELRQFENNIQKNRIIYSSSSSHKLRENKPQGQNSSLTHTYSQSIANKLLPAPLRSPKEIVESTRLNSRSKFLPSLLFLNSLKNGIKDRQITKEISLKKEDLLACAYNSYDNGADTNDAYTKRVGASTNGTYINGTYTSSCTASSIDSKQQQKWFFEKPESRRFGAKNKHQVLFEDTIPKMSIKRNIYSILNMSNSSLPILKKNTSLYKNIKSDFSSNQEVVSSSDPKSRSSQFVVNSKGRGCAFGEGAGFAFSATTVRAAAIEIMEQKQKTPYDGSKILSQTYFYASLLLYEASIHVKNSSQFFDTPTSLFVTNQTKPLSLYASLYASPQQFKAFIVNFISGKLGETLLFNGIRPASFVPKNKKASNGFSLPPSLPLVKSTGVYTAYGLSSTWEALSSLVFSFVQKRFLYHSNLIVPKLLDFNNKTSLLEKPSPPFANILLPARKYENSRRSFSVFSGQQISKQIGIMEKIQAHQQQRLIKRLYGLPLQELFRSERKENSSTSFSNASLMIGSYGSAASSILQKPSNSNWFVKNRIFKRHQNYLTNQWWNGQLSEHNAETILLSNFDLRLTFVESIGDIYLDFPDANQHYNTQNRRWLLTKGSYHNWFDFDKTIYSEIYSHFIFESFVKAYSIYEKNREVLDFYAYYVLKKGLHNVLNELSIFKLYKRFGTLIKPTPTQKQV